jgi:hypothetical protein
MFLAVFLLLAAQNTGNNLLYLMSSCFLSVVVLIAVLAFRNISGFQAVFELPEVVSAGSEAIVRCRITEKGGREHLLLGFGKDLLSQVAAKETVILKTSVEPGMRGKLVLSEFNVFSFFPCGFFAVSLMLPDVEVWVGPKPGVVPGQLIDREIGGAIQKFQTGKEGEYWMQKHYSPGEDAGLINWTISARSDTEWVLMKTQNYGFPEKLVFDLSGLDEEIFEDCLELVMGILHRLKSAGSHAFVWAEKYDGNYGWLSICDNYADLVKWLARIEYKMPTPPPLGEYEGIDFAKLMRSVNE